MLREGDRDRLAELARLPSVPSGLAKRARMVLLAADGMPNVDDRPGGGGVAADGDRLAGPLPAARDQAALEDEPRVRATGGRS